MERESVLDRYFDNIIVGSIESEQEGMQSMTTKLQSGVWNIGQVKNVGTATQNGLQVTADFYDTGGNNIGGNKT